MRAARLRRTKGRNGSPLRLRPAHSFATSAQESHGNGQRDDKQKAGMFVTYKYIELFLKLEMLEVQTNTMYR